MPKALITGITGQDGSYLAELLLEKGYEVHGIVRRSSSFNRGRIDHLHTPEEGKESKIFLHYADMGDSSSLFRVINEIRPDEVYNLAAQSHVQVSFEIPEYTADVTGVGVCRLLEAIRAVDKNIKFYQASSSELFGKVEESPQTEKTPFHPRSPYACAKAYAFWIVKNYREAYGMYAVNGILFNHESSRRGRNFVTRKIVRGLCKIKNHMKEPPLELGNLNAKRDWGDTRDYVEAMWKMLQQDSPEDLVIATGTMKSVRDFVEATAQELGITITWEGEGVNEVGKDGEGRELIVVNKRYFRPSEVDTLQGDASKAKETLGWTPKTSFENLVKNMVREELLAIEKKNDLF